MYATDRLTLDATYILDNCKGQGGRGIQIGILIAASVLGRNTFERTTCAAMEDQPWSKCLVFPMQAAAPPRPPHEIAEQCQWTSNAHKAT